MTKIRIVLDTQTDVTEFVSIANSFPETTQIFLEDGTGFKANAKSLMGVMYGKFEFKELYVLSEDNQLSNKFNKFMI